LVCISEKFEAAECISATSGKIHIYDYQIVYSLVMTPIVNQLGACQIGDFCSIGAHATILPRVRIGNRVNIGAEAIIRDEADGQTLVGVQGRAIGNFKMRNSSYKLL
jgi:acetyltransferase-like isoleucine patch superfamily enzyme